MFALGQKQTFALQYGMSALPNSGHVRCNSACPLCANSGHSAIHSITSAARGPSFAHHNVTFRNSEKFKFRY